MLTPMMHMSFLIAAGLLLLFIGGEVLLRGAVGLAKYFRLSPLVIGLTVVAYGTSSPELVVSVHAAIEGLPDITLGNIIGSNISNILLVLGLTSLIYPIAIDKKLANQDVVFLCAITIILYVLCYPGFLGFIAGIIFFAILVYYTRLTFRAAKTEGDTLPEHQTEEVESQIKLNLPLPLTALACVVGIGLLAYGADLLIEGSVILARHFGMSEAVIGLTLIAFGSSAPELFTSMVAAIHKHADVALGNIVGSCIFNILGILGVTTLISDVAVASRFLTFDLAILLFISMIFLLILKRSSHLNRLHGVVFVVAYASYVTVLLTMK